jgi:NAD dependent epimerase/dehydratase family enzyme
VVKNRKQIKVHIPDFILKVVLGELSIEILKSCTVSADKILGTLFQFQYSSIDKAIEDLEKSALL